MKIDHAVCAVQRCTLCSLRKLCIRYWDQPEDRRAIDLHIKAFDLNLRRTSSLSCLNFAEMPNADSFGSVQK